MQAIALSSHTLTCFFCDYLTIALLVIIDFEGNTSQKDTSPMLIFNSVYKEVPGNQTNAPV